MRETIAASSKAIAFLQKLFRRPWTIVRRLAIFIKTARRRRAGTGLKRTVSLGQEGPASRLMCA